jgi:environmental stress-induced protein Ves
MILTHLTAESFVVSAWAGGVTTQIAIAPPRAAYADRDFLWRVSSASVETETSDFTALPDYWRWITPLSGSMTLFHDGGDGVRLAPYEVHRFDGGAATRSQGRCTDFNLMLRKGQAQGRMYARRLSAGSACSVVFSGGLDRRSPDTVLLFCGAGGASVTVGDERVLLGAMEAVMVENAAGPRVEVKAAADSRFVIAEIESGGGGSKFP